MFRPPALRVAFRLAAVLLLALAPFCARAATVAPASAAGPPLTPAEAQSLIGVLNDPGKRLAFTHTLSELVTASRAVAAKTAPAAPGLVPHSIGAELLTGVGTFGDNLAAEGHGATRALRNFHLLGPWVHGIVSDPARRAIVVDSVWRLAVVIGAALLAVLGAERAIRRPVASLSRLAGGTAPPPAPTIETLAEEDDEHPLALPEDGFVAVDTQEAPETTKRRHGAGFLRLLHALRRVPFAIVHFLLELVPVVAFLVVTAGFEMAGFVDRLESLMVVSAATRSFVIAGVLIGLVNTLFSPAAAPLRLILVNEGPARRTAFWCRLGISVAAFALAAIGVAETLGLPPYAAAALTKAVALVEHGLLACLIVASRRDVARALTPPRRMRGPARRLLSGLAHRWWLIAIFFDFAFWAIWAAEVRNGYARLWTFTIETVCVVLVARMLAVASLGGLERMFRLTPDTASQHPWLQTRVDRYYPVFRRFTGFVLAAIAVVTLLEVWGLHAYSWFARGALGGRVVGAGVSVLASIAVGIVIWEATNTAVARHLDRRRLEPVGGGGRGAGRRRRADRAAEHAAADAADPAVRLRRHRGGADGAFRDRRQHRAASRGRRHRRRRDRLWFAEARAGFHHRHLSPAREHDAGRRHDHRRRPLRDRRTSLDPDDAAPGGRRLGACHPVLVGEHGDQQQSRPRQCRGERRHRARGGSGSRERGPEGDRRRHA